MLRCFVLIVLLIGQVLATNFTQASSTYLKACSSQLDIEPIAELKGEAYLCGDHPELGRELFRTNGTHAGTSLIADINSGSGSSDPSGMFELNGNLFYSADDSINGIGLWRTKIDGDSEETVRIKTIIGAQKVGFSVVFRGRDFVIFRARRDTAGPDNRREVSRTLWRSDGTADGTYRLEPNIYEGPSAQFTPFPSSSVYSLSDRIYYTTLNSLYRFNVFTEKSTLIKTFSVMGDEEFEGFGLRIIGAAGGSQVYLQYQGAPFGRSAEIWISDGTIDGTVRVQSDAEAIGAYRGKVIACELNSNDVFLIDQHESELIFTIPTDSSRLCAQNFSSFNVDLVGDRYIFQVFSPTFPLFSTDLTVEGSFGLANSNGYDIGSGPIGVTNSRLIYTDLLGLVSTDGTFRGTRRIATMNGKVNLALVRRELPIREPISSSPSEAEPNFLLFIIDNEGVYELWRTDGTASGSLKLLHLPESGQAYLGREGQRRFFLLDDGVIWHSDGTVRGTYPLTYPLGDQSVDDFSIDNIMILAPIVDLLLENEE